jgi:2-polyprenyl-3-methyl-5-hydroxy-6-metoxy-1,4-benzoquinol methylase
VVPVIKQELPLIKHWMAGGGGPILDIGSSTADFRQRPKLRYDLAELLGAHVVSVDIKRGPGVDIVCDAHRLTEQMARASASGVICTSLLEHVSRPWIVVEQLAEVLQPGGRIFLSAPWRYADHADPEDNYRFSVGGLRSLAAFVGLGELASGMLHDGPHAISFWVGFRRG